MAIFGKDRERSDRSLGVPPLVAGPLAESAPPAPREGAPRTSSGDAGATSAFLGKGSRITGKLAFEGPVRIEGHVEGEITAQDTLTIGEAAVVMAQISGNAVVIQGRVTGDVTARKRLEIRAPGRLIGNIVTPSLVIHEGVVFEGQCTMGTTAQAAAGVAPEPPVRGEKERKLAPFHKEERSEGGRAQAEGAAK